MLHNTILFKKNVATKKYFIKIKKIKNWRFIEQNDYLSNKIQSF